jgi:hypothetical protein
MFPQRCFSQTILLNTHAALGISGFLDFVHPIFLTEYNASEFLSISDQSNN